MSKRATKTLWHLVASVAAGIEWATSQTDFRKHVAGACFGWHLSFALVDFLDKENA